MLHVSRCQLSLSVRFRCFRRFWSNEVSFHGRLHSVNLVRDILLVNFAVNLRGLDVTVSEHTGDSQWMHGS